MESIGLNELRERYLSFFESKGHLRLASFSLVPQHDPSLLFINAGMAPLKPYFTGAAEPPARRVTNCQKCIRTQDIDIVGRTSRHATFFEMLGNFSFADYFKKEAIFWAWEFLTEELKIPQGKLYATVFLDDDEAHSIWKNVSGIDHSHISRLGAEHNFWEHGTGPCGPSSEIYYDRGKEFGCTDPNCAPGCDCDRFVEIWNLVFTQFNKEEDGSYTPLAQKNIDTGAGLERLSAVLQVKNSIFEIDTIVEILSAVEEICQLKTGVKESSDVSLRVITDHIRSSVMLISDVILPGNEGRGYVLRRLIRRAALHGRLQGVKRPFLADLVPTVGRISAQAYPELLVQEKMIQDVLRQEEERFSATVSQGMNLLKNLIDKVHKEKSSVLQGAELFKLHDTFGFSIELTKEIAANAGLSIDEEGFRLEMEKQRSAARKALLDRIDTAWGQEGMPAKLSQLRATKFVGYDHLNWQSSLDLIIRPASKDAKMEIIDQAKEGDSLIVVLPETPFYAEGGGQTGDKGYIYTKSGRLKVNDTTVTEQGVYLHHVLVESGEAKRGDEASLQVDAALRLRAARNHTATHLLYKALQEVLGKHVNQAGSFVNLDYLRFDFSHPKALTEDETYQVELLVNQAISRDYPLTTELMTLDEAVAAGARPMFDEKYGEQVRVIKIGDFSLELCGGTHLKNTSQAMAFVISTETAISAGVRRIEAVTGLEAILALDNAKKILRQAADKLKTTPAEINQKIANLQSELKELKAELSDFKAKDSHANAKALLEKVTEINGVKILVAKVEAQDAKQLRAMGDHIRDHFESVVLILAAAVDKRVLWLGMASQQAVEHGIHCGNIIREAAEFTGGGGGGRPDMAQAGGREVEKLAAALELCEKIIAKQLQK